MSNAIELVVGVIVRSRKHTVFVRIYLFGDCRTLCYPPQTNERFDFFSHYLHYFMYLYQQVPYINLLLVGLAKPSYFKC